MGDERQEVFVHSSKLLMKFGVIAAFYQDPVVDKLFQRTQLIHRLFETNTELDINKLELFHVQFTVTTLDLLNKIKKSNEGKVSLIYDEIELNKEALEKISRSLDSDFLSDSVTQASKIGLSLRRLYRELSDGTSGEPFSRNILAFAGRHAGGEFYPLEQAQVQHIVSSMDQKQVYLHAKATIERKLMGLLCKHDFSVTFYKGFRGGNAIFEVYQIPDALRYFFFLQPFSFFLCDPSDFEREGVLTESGKTSRSRQHIQSQLTLLDSQVKQTKTFIPEAVRALLEDTYLTISNFGFLQNLSNVDAQASILRAMLNTDSL